MGDLWYLALAYSVIWLGLIAYLVRLSRHAQNLRQELQVLRDELRSDPKQRPAFWDEGESESEAEGEEPSLEEGLAARQGRPAPGEV
ncbi:MAG: CcmD family protein [Chloroflexota bacterium]|nr:CcmD family protein [Chloroflexota bacterium]